MNYTKPSLPESRRHSFDAEYSADQVQAHADACVAAALAHYKAAAPLCDKHQPSGGTRSCCLVCGLQSQSAALSKISYLCGPPNEMECGPYDVHCNEDAVVDQVRAALAHVRAEQGEPLKQRPDFIAGYLDGMADGQRIAERNALPVIGTPPTDPDYEHSEAFLREQSDLPPSSLLVESAQGFVEGWTRSQVRSAINLALLTQRYAAPQAQQPVSGAADPVGLPAGEQTGPVSAAPNLPEWPCRCDEQGIGEPGVTCGDCPRDYGHKVSAAPTLTDAQRKLAAFGAWCAQEFREDMGDVDGGSAQEAMERCGVLVAVEVAGPCSEFSCRCAEYCDWPMQCYRYPDDVRAAIEAAIAAKANA